ncbi:kinesin-like protein KIF2A isoform X2 [Nematostella vectensis]|uniref:kinesin-like protein KIF2A isoform X2 n=1 Tax=Nematostella vectensis TaxID=45351 RepID=UPI002077479A|nr:kinesin-like protein KIF2A isoform X2 [Nematostella vectensis]
MASDTILYTILQQSSLDKYYENFTSQGIENPESLVALTMQDYPAFGITSMHDREMMFALIQRIKENKATTRSSRTLDPLLSGSEVAAKKPRVSTNDSPALEKAKSKTFVRESQSKQEKRITLTPIKSQAPVGYNYGVPSSKPKSKGAAKQMFQAPSHASHESRIRVCVRKRPLSRDEKESGEEDVAAVNARDSIVISSPKVAVDLKKYTQQYPFMFDEVFDERYTNREVYERTAKPMVNAIFSRGVKATCFAYGCTGSGKTHTMLGTEDIPGLYLLAASDIFTVLHSSHHGHGISMWISFYEIYCGQLFDLLNGREKLFARENATHQVCIAGLTHKRVENVEQLMEVIESGGNARSTGATGVNADSSRSHAILQLELKADSSGEGIGRFSFIDLAGSERAVDVTDTDKQTRMEGAEINQSLLALKECIRSLDQESRHTPFRQSKLTQVLKDSFVGNTMTCMIANISPSLSSCENTLNTLRYADRYYLGRVYRVKELKKEGTLATPARPVTVHGTDSKSWPDSTQASDTASYGSDLGKVTSQNARLQMSKSQNTAHLQKALKRLKMDEAELTGGNARPHTMATPSRTSASVSSGSTKTVRSTRAPETSSEGTQGVPRLATKRITNVLKVNEEVPSDEEVPRGVSRGRVNPSTAERRTKSRFTNRAGKAENMEHVNMEQVSDASQNKTQDKRDVKGLKEPNQEVLEDSTEVSGNSDASQRRFYGYEGNGKGRKKAGEVKTSRFAQRSRDYRSVGNVNAQSSLSSRGFSIGDEEVSGKPGGAKKTEKPTGGRAVIGDSCTSGNEGRVVDEEKPPRKQAPIVTSISCTKSMVVESRGEQRGSHQEMGGEEGGDQEVSPNMNNRYSKRIKARLARLFNGKTGEESHTITVDESPVRPTRHLEPIPASKTSPCAITDEQVVAAHHTHLAMVTGLCHEEMVLLKHIDKGEQDFVEYVAQLEDILIQKQACIDNLQEKLLRWKSRCT